MKTILFYWSKGADTRRNILKAIIDCNEKNKPCFLNHLANKLKLTHVAVKKHLELLIEEGYVKELNPNGKPIFLELTEEGKNVLKELGYIK